MQRAFGLDIPQSVDELCDPGRMAILVYDMQVGVLSQIAGADELTARVVTVSVPHATSACGSCSFAT